MKKIIKLILFLLLSISLSFSLTDYSAQAKSGGHSTYKSSDSGGKSTYVKGYTRKDSTHVAPYYRSSQNSKSKSYESSPSSTVGVQRDSHGRIKRSSAARTAFKHSHPCPSTGKSSGPCPGYVIDHVQALKHGGADSPSNMQWQTIEEANWFKKKGDIQGAKEQLTKAIDIFRECGADGWVEKYEKELANLT